MTQSHDIQGFDTRARARADAAFNWAVAGIFGIWIIALVATAIYADSFLKVFGGSP